MLKRLRIKFIAITMTIVSIMLLIIFGLVLYFTQLNYAGGSMELMRSIAMSPPDAGKHSRPGEFMPIPSFVLQSGEDGGLIIRGGEEFFDLSDTARLEELMSVIEGSDKNEGMLAEYRLRYLRLVSPEGEIRTVFMDATAELYAMYSLFKACVLIGLVSLAAFFALSVFLARVTVKPVENAWDEQRQFVTDASHELKTPLAVITTNAELLRSDAYSLPEKRVFADNILTVAKGMGTLVEDLLELARADNGSMQQNPEDVDMSALVEEGLMLFEVLYYENGLKLESRVEKNIVLKGGRIYLAQLVEILLDNAMKYSDPGTAVKLSLERKPGCCLLSVENQGESLDSEALKSIFKRFYRTDKARSDSDSYGLGLPIAESIVKAHKGKIWAESENGLNRFFVRLPIASSAV